MPAPHRCVLIRHGETEWSRDRRHTGRTDLPLLPEGRRQAQAVADRLDGWAFGAVWSSPLLRARETFALAGLGDDPPVDPDLAEWDYGRFEGWTTDEIRTEWPGWELFADGCPEGEDAGAVGARADRVIARIRAVDGDVACVAHGHLLRVLATRWVGLDPGRGRTLALDPASVSVLGWDRDGPLIERWNVS